MNTSDAAALTFAFAGYDLNKSIAAIGGLLTLPILQANLFRLEEIARLALANCGGRQSPTLKVAARWFKVVGAHVGHMEDPTEDVFVTRVIFDGRNYRILEGLYEANGHYLQHILRVVERMPRRDDFVAIKRDCKALLSLSDLLCDRAGLDAFIEGSKFPLEAFPISKVPTMKRLATLTTFSYRDLAATGCDANWLGRFILSPNVRSVGWTLGERNAFDKQPLLDTGSDIIVGLPSALGAAIREAVIESFIGTGREVLLQMELLRTQTDALSQNPMVHKARIPTTAIAPNNAFVPSSPVEIEPGYWLHFILLTDDFQGFEHGGLCGTSSRGTAVALALQAEVDQASEYCRAQPGFKVGLTFIVICGFGRTIGLSVNGAEDWLVQGGSDYDADVMGWLHDFDFSELIRLSTMERDLASKGFEIYSPNGLLAKVGFAYANRRHLVHHESMPDEFDSGIIYIPTNAALELRADHHRRSDIRTVATPEGRFTVVRRRGNSELTRTTDSKMYCSLEDITRGTLRGVWIHKSRAWWVHLSDMGATDGNFAYRVWDMQCVWLERIVHILCRVVTSVPDFLVWQLNMAPWEPIPVSEMLPVTLEEIKSDISSRVDTTSATIITEVGSTFYHGLYRADNAAEVAIVQSFVEQVLVLAGQPYNRLEPVISEIVASPDARQMHAFAPQDFRDHVREAIENRVVAISPFDDAAVRIGLGWAGVNGRGGTVLGRDKCTAALNKITSELEQDLCLDLAKFERRAIVEAAVANHEAAAVDRSTWYRTSRALTGLAEDESIIRGRMAEHLSKSNVVFLMSRLLIEVALSECPFGSGMEPSDSDLSRLMAKASAIFHLGGYSDAIRYGGMKPEVHISPAGQVMIDPTFFDTIVEPVGRSFADRMIDDQRNRYTELLREPALDTRSLEELMDGEFLGAWQAEVGASLVDCRGAVEALENKLIHAGVGWDAIPRPELVDFLKDHIQDPEAYVKALESVPREGWKRVPAPFLDQDRQPWRFRRRLAVFRRPLLRLCNSEEASVLVVPGLLRESLLTMMHNFYGAEIGQELLTSGKMRRWWNLVQDRGAKEFESMVCGELQKLGWGAASRKKFSEILGTKLCEDPGDIDVLAWQPDGRIVILECKNLRLARTPSEAAKQLSKYQGITDERGRPDMLAKHLRRVALAEDHITAFQKYTGVQNASIEGVMVFSSIVPMMFAEQRMKNRQRHLTVDQLSEL